MPIVVDASAVVELLLRTGAGEVVERHVAEADAVFAPELLDVEVMSVLRRMERIGQLEPAAASSALAVMTTAPIMRVAHAGLLLPAWDRRHNVSSFDAVYVALAAVLGCSLVTADRRLAGAPALGVSLVLIGV